MNIMYEFLHGQMFSFLSGIYLRVDLLDHMITLCFITLEELPNYKTGIVYFFKQTFNFFKYKFCIFLPCDLRVQFLKP